MNRRITLHPARIAIVAIAIVSLVTLSSRDHASAHDTGQRVDIRYGLLSGTGVYHYGWHAEAGGRSALDFNHASDSNMAVYFKAGNITANLTAVAALTSGSCTGYDISLYVPSTGEFLGTERYLHISPTTPLPPWTVSSSSASKLLGWVATSQPNCSWSGPHLHQSGQTANTHLWSNQAITLCQDSAQTFAWCTAWNGSSNPQGVGSSTYIHQVRF